MEDVHGNRGKCAQGCRLPYTLLENDKVIDKGYLLSPKDLCSLELLPNLVEIGVDSFKIEGRMKTPEYVATVTRIYRKYLDKILKDEEYIIEEQDKKELLQVFNRGGFSCGHLKNEANKELIFKEKPNHQGIYIGNVSKFNNNKGHISLCLNAPLSIGDTITFENEDTKYTVSELMLENQNIETAKLGQKVIIGRMKGNINIGDKIYKLSSKALLTKVKKQLTIENKKIGLNAILDVKLNEPIKLIIEDNENNSVTLKSDSKPEIAINSPITKEKLETQLNKLNNTPFYFKNIKISLDDNLFVPHISTINELRRNAISQYSDIIINKYNRKPVNYIPFSSEEKNISKPNSKHGICLLLNIINLDFDYLKLENVDKLYIPLKYFYLKEYANPLRDLTKIFSTYIYLPNILKPNFRNLFKNIIDDSLKNYNIKGFVVSNIGYFDLLQNYKNNYEFIGNYNLNVFNNATCNILPVSTITISPELNKEEINFIAFNNTYCSEFIVYGNIPLMTSSYCLLGNTNKCYPDCAQKCKSGRSYYLKDRMNFKFKILPDNIQTISTIYNSKISSINPNEISNVTNYRIDILEETIEEINHIIHTVRNGNRLEGKDYTNGNLNREV